jgi:hypothetical protein
MPKWVYQSVFCSAADLDTQLSALGDEKDFEIVAILVHQIWEQEPSASPALPPNYVGGSIVTEYRIVVKSALEP